MYSCEHGRQKTPCIECDRERDQLRADLAAERQAHDESQRQEQASTSRLVSELAAARAEVERLRADYKAACDLYKVADRERTQVRAAIKAANERIEQLERALSHPDQVSHTSEAAALKEAALAAHAAGGERE